MARIQVVGHACVDLSPQLPEVSVPAPGVLAEVGPMGVSIGGAAGNCGRALARLGESAHVTCAIGDDALGLLLADALRAEHGERVSVQNIGGTTSYSVVLVHASGERSFWHHVGSNERYLLDCPIEATALVHFGYPSLMPASCREDGAPVRAMFERAHAAGCATSLDLAFLADNSPLRGLDWDAYLANVLPEADLFCPSWEDLDSLGARTGTFAAAAIEAWAADALARGCGVVLVTAGREGAYLAAGDADALARLAASCPIDPTAWAGARRWVPAPRVDRIVSANGAGDTYKAGFLTALADGLTPDDALGRAGEVVAAHLSGSLGGGR